VEDREEPQAGSTSHRPLTVSARGNRPWHLFLMAGLAVGVFALAWSEVGAPASSSRVSRQIVLAQRGVVQSTVSGTGNVEAGTDVSVNFQASGTLADVFVKVGDHVSQGQLLATLDPTSAQLSVAQAEKTLTAAKDQLKAARQTSTSSTTTGASLQTNGGGSAEFVSETVRHVPSTTTATTTTTTRTQGTPRPRPKRKTSGKTTVPQTTTTTTTGLDAGRSAGHPHDCRRELERLGDDQPDHQGSEHRHGAGIRLQRRSQPPKCRDICLEHEALRAHQRDDRLALDPPAGRPGVQREL
jgi:hypothetical protein